MSRRITLAILLTVWAMLVAGGVAAYLTTRSLLLADLDNRLVDRALEIPELSRLNRRPGPSAVLAGGDRYFIREANTHQSQVTRPPPAAQYEVKGVEGNFLVVNGQRARTVTFVAQKMPAASGGPPAEVAVTYTGSAEGFHRLLEYLALTLGGCVLVGGIVSAGLAYRVSQISLRPLRQTAETIGAIDERRLDRRIPADALPPELVPMADRLNEMLARLEQAFAQRRQFLADASHEMRTPVAALVTGLEVTLARPRQAETYRAALADALNETQHLRRLVERLMEQARSENFSHDERPRDVDVSALFNQCADVTEALGTGQDVRVVRNYPPDLHLTTQPGRLQSVVQNLMANAVHYNRPGGEVRLTAREQGIDIEFEVTDTGQGIPADQLPQLFEPFFRGDAAHRSDSDGHLGLGLFLVQSHLLALGGRCTVESEFGKGTTFRVKLPGGATGTEIHLSKMVQVELGQRALSAGHKAG